MYTHVIYIYRERERDREREGERSIYRQARAHRDAAREGGRGAQRHINGVVSKIKNIILLVLEFYPKVSSLQFSGFGQVGTHHRVRNSRKINRYYYTVYYIRCIVI